MAVPFDLETDIPIGNEGDSSADVVAVFTEALKLATAGVIDLTAGLVAPPVIGAFQRVVAGTNNFSYGLGTDASVAPNNLPGALLLYTHCFGMEIAEWVSWYFKGGGDALVNSILTDAEPGGVYPGAGALDNPYFLPIATRAAESGGWFKEAITLKKLADGKYSDGNTIKLRQFGESQPAMAYAFPNVSLPPPATTGTAFLDDILNGVVNGGMWNEPFGEAAPISLVNGIFPAWPGVVGSIIDLGVTHYYMSAWHSPARVHNVWINRTYWNGLSADDQKRFKYAAMASCLENIAISHMGQDAIIKQFQTLGATIHEHLPVDVLRALGEGTLEAQDNLAAADASGAYQAILDHQRAFIRENHVRWRSSTINRRLRFERRWPYESVLQPNVKLGS